MAAASATPAAAGSGAISAEAAAVAGSRGNMRAMATVGPVGQASAVYASRWRCGACSAMNAPAKMKCGRCRAAKPANASTVVVKAPSSASNWTEAFDAGTQQIYYYNKATGKSQWTRPEELGPAPHATGWFGRGASGSQAALRYAQLNAAWLKRPARKQSDIDLKAPGYTEGQQTYNIWYGRYDGSTKEGRLLPGEPAPSRCCLAQDAGWTQADRERSEKRYFCLFFSRGSCAYGQQCSYHHHLPGPEDERGLEGTRDIFGRQRHAEHRDDMSGVGSYTSQCRTLYVGGIRADTPVSGASRRGGQGAHDAVVGMLARHFGEWGEIENINYIDRKSIAFVRYRLRVNAEFAHEAMDHQALDGKEVINVRWAYDDPNPVAQEAAQRADEDAFLIALQARGMTLVSDEQAASMDPAVNPALAGLEGGSAAPSGEGGGEGGDGGGQPEQGGGSGAALEALSQDAFYQAVAEEVGACPTQDTDSPEYASWYAAYTAAATRLWPVWQAKGGGAGTALGGAKRTREEGGGDTAPSDAAASDAAPGASPAAKRPAP